ncbi:MAG: helix-turn-helix transcriptional regulator [Nocardiopsaceae bacterium]|nr:helix-turn-helix transcriptional regulator [Nocardiopsaceae bacterium]
MGHEGGLAEGARDEALGRRLRALRAERGWSQGTLREKSGVSEATIRSIESNYPHTRRHGRATLMALSRALDLPSDYLINYLENPPQKDVGNQPAATDAEPQQPVLDVIARGMQEVLARINEIVVPRLDRIETQLNLLVEAHYPGIRNTHMDPSQPSDDEEEDDKE